MQEWISKRWCRRARACAASRSSQWRARVIEEIIEVAKRAPGRSMKHPALALHVLTGDPLEEVRRRNMEEMMAGAEPKRDIISHGEYQGVHRGRQVDVAKEAFSAVMGIARDASRLRRTGLLRGFRQFDAPVSLVLTYDRILDRRGVPLRSRRALLWLGAWPHGTAGLAASSRPGHHPLGYSCARSPLSPRKRSS